VSGRENFVIGVDFGTDSVRAVVVDTADGRIEGSAVKAYPRWAQGLFCEPRESRYRQHPMDYVETLEASVRAAMVEATEKRGAGVAGAVRGLCVDTTGSTPCFADARGWPLALLPGFEDEPDAMFILWKDHSGVAEAARINGALADWKGTDFARYSGGVYSSEWFWAKALRVVERNPRVSAAAATVVEHCDWIPALLTGVGEHSAIRRSRCAMGHKAMWHESWGGYPSPDFLSGLHPRLAELRSSLGTETWTTDEPAGTLSAEWAGRLGLGQGVTVCVGAYDAHVGAVGGDVAPGTLLKIMGTSTCDIMVGPRPGGEERPIPGICGQVDGSVVPGMIGYEAGQSAYGDLFAWFRSLLAWPLRNLPDFDEGLRERVEAALLPALEEAAGRIDPSLSSLVALDWLNGRRTPDADQGLTGAIAGLSLGTDAPAVYRALVEAAAFGSRAIVERLREQGVTVDRVAAVGGVARKSPLVMQVAADVLAIPITVSSSDQSCALGAAMFAAVASGLYPDVLSAQAAMRAPVERTYLPDQEMVAAYDRLYREYRRLGAYVEGAAATKE
jgi:L-ribulokinase